MQYMLIAIMNHCYRRFYLADVATLTNFNKIWEQTLNRIVFTYDINCKYKVNLYDRSVSNKHSPITHQFQTRLQPSAKKIEFLVNVFHQRAHNPECADEHSIRNTPLVGMMSGEDVESPWAVMNFRQYSLREMGAGARRDALETHIHHWNTKKMLAIGKWIANELIEGY